MEHFTYQLWDGRFPCLPTESRADIEAVAKACEMAGWDADLDHTVIETRTRQPSRKSIIVARKLRDYLKD